MALNTRTDEAGATGRMAPHCRHMLARGALMIATAIVTVFAGCTMPVDEPQQNLAQQSAPSTVIQAPVTVTCGGSEDPVQPVLVSWLDPDDTALGNGAAVQLTNTTSQPIVVTLKSQFNGANVRLPLADQVVSIAAASSTIATIDPSPIATQLQQEVTPVAVAVEALVDDSTFWAELRYVHSVSQESNVFQWYSDRHLARYTKIAFNAAAAVVPTSFEDDLTGTIQVVTTGLNVTDPATLQGNTATSPEADAALTTAANAGGASQSVCFYLSADYAQGGVDFAQEDPGFNNVLKPAYATKMWISVPGIGTFFWATPRSGAPCVSFPAQPAGTPLYFGMFFEAHLGSLPNRNIRVRSFDRAGTPWAWQHQIEPWEVPRNAYYLESQGPGSIVDLVTHPGNWRMANSLAVGIEQVTFYDHALGDGSNFDEWINFRAEHCPDLADHVSCASSSQAFIAEGDFDSYKAELLGHELGHIIEKLYTTYEVPLINPDHYEAPVSDLACDGFGELHALQSKEWSNAALKEGLASALGALALSNAPSWRYYKSIEASGGIYHNQIVDLTDASTFNRLNNLCTTGGTVGFGVEWDWLHFLWAYPDAAGISLATLFQRLNAAAPNMNTTNVYLALRDATPAAERALLDNRAILHGVYRAP